jgi:sialic acid synthase SpsE
MKDIKIIAEIGQNHNGDMNRAKELIKAAKCAGADIAKFQLFEARSLFVEEDNPWFQYNCETELSRQDLYFLANECVKNDIEFMASAFDVKRIQWLEDVDVRRHKIASRSIKDPTLKDKLIGTKKPLLVSLGFWDAPEFPDFSAAASVDFLYCVSHYPAPLKSINLADVDFSTYSGFSDHTIGTSAAIAAVARGARIIEKHFTLDKQDYGPDHSCSMTPHDLHSLSTFVRDFKELI